MHSCSSLENHTRFQTKMGIKSIPVIGQNGTKTLPFGAAHTLYGLYKGIPLGRKTLSRFVCVLCAVCPLPRVPLSLVTL